MNNNDLFFIQLSVDENMSDLKYVITYCGTLSILVNSCALLIMVSWESVSKYPCSCCLATLVQHKMALGIKSWRLVESWKKVDFIIHQGQSKNNNIWIVHCSVKKKKSTGIIVAHATERRKNLSKIFLYVDTCI